MSPFAKRGQGKAARPIRGIGDGRSWQFTLDQALKKAAGPEGFGARKYRGGKDKYLEIDRPASYIDKLLEQAARKNASIIKVSAVAGAVPSTREQILLARKLGVRSLLVIVNDVDKASASQLQLVEDELRELLAPHGFVRVTLVRVGAAPKQRRRALFSRARVASPGDSPEGGDDDDGDDDMEPAKDAALDRGVIRVWYATNRRPADADDPNRGYSGGRATGLSYGSCDVFIPECHKMGSIGSSFLKRILTLKDDRLKLRKTRRTPVAAHWKEIAARLSQAKPDKRHALVFIHGYNVPFKQAALRTAQIAADLSFPGPASFFSWPSRGRLADYIKDAASIEASEADIARYLADFAEHSGATSIHVVAHSMGNRGVLRAINRIVSEQPKPLRPLFDQIILAAADVDRQVFSDLAPACCELGRRTTMYVSARDRAVGASEWLHDFPRAGLVPPVTVLPKIDTINVTNVDLTRLGHGYIAESRDVLHDMRDVMLTGEPAGERFAHRQATTPEGGVYWIIGA